MLRLGIGIIQTVSRLLAILGAIIVFVLLLATMIDVAMRNLLDEPAPGVFEYSEIGLVAIIFLGIPYTMQVGGHVSVDSLTKRLSQRRARMAEATGLLVAIPLAGWWAVASIDVAVESYRINELRAGLTEVPVWPARALIALSLALLFMEILIYAGRLLVSTPQPDESGITGRVPESPDQRTSATRPGTDVV